MPAFFLLFEKMKEKFPIYKDWFLCGMVACVVLATFFPQIGKSDGVLRAGTLADYGIAAIFFLHGLGLSWKNLRAGLFAWKIHATVQTLTFAVFPLITLCFCQIFDNALHWLPPSLALGFYFLGALPSTISSSVAMTALARGNVPAAIFNASASSILGIFFTPLIIGIFAARVGGSFPIGESLQNLLQLLFLPFLLGQLLNPLLYQLILPFKHFINTFDKCVILLIVFASFSDAVAGGLWGKYGFGILLKTLLGTALVLAVALLIAGTLARVFAFNKEDEIATVFCGSKKTLAAGVPMAKILFSASALSGEVELGLIVLPIMFYHQLQLFACTLLANRYAVRAE